MLWHGRFLARCGMRALAVDIRARDRAGFLQKLSFGPRPRGFVRFPTYFNARLDRAWREQAK
jgi:hypothetical protein